MNLYQGVWVALVTPFKNGQVDEAAFQSLVSDLATRGIAGFIPVGTTGEASTLSAEERRRVIELCVEAAGDVSVVPGCGTNDTVASIRNCREAADLGASGAMVITPYYNKPTQDGLLAHFTTVAKSTELPLLLYNVPSRTGVNLLPETVEKLADLPNVDGIKEASGNLVQIADLCARVEGRMNILSGDDALTLPVLAVGGEGVVSVVANLEPEPLVEMVDIFWKDNPYRALQLHRRITPLAQALFLETSPSPIKCALWMDGKIQNEVRLPLVTVKAETRERIGQAVREYRNGVMGHV
ncbi:4-hydroxy-tetrahydrodipicolinate synthase [bacterium]|nr:4-hydroxy-tetrahydrodipicolinate synthase [bacterium]MBU1983115.1 4-hydroxy-tetrahydrodipicolinate synthase [bacterium]